ncbi:hypothetical protein [Mycoplana rhizolycopersici]|uniref:Uncharacterized protein n=1 Tax=Mycoplana rhizolycopersici TaxID=2746702 RepID=A0ABX2Q9R9_9HYPH|nr:hypothetical protein [Rhizobium rhizolycopersici]NVP54458.1 hypothetical protein [Rhizobium rhizolycopersici]
MDAPSNPLRGEAEVRIGDIEFRIAVTWSGLVRLSKAMNADGIETIYRRLFSFEPFAVACAVRALIVADDEDKASGLCARILRDDNISIADSDSWQVAVETAFTAHARGGSTRRDQRSAHEIAEDAVLGNPLSPF